MLCNISDGYNASEVTTIRRYRYLIITTFEEDMSYPLFLW